MLDSDDFLTSARESAAKCRDYNYAATRHAIKTKFRAVFSGKSPYSWQVDVTEALLLGLDCVVIAGTGSGKTMPFGMPLLLDEAKEKIVVVISPLNELEAEQVSILIFGAMFVMFTFLRLKDSINSASRHLLSMLMFITNNCTR
jgi:DEAD/DEAH box helicase